VYGLYRVIMVVRNGLSASCHHIRRISLTPYLNPLPHTIRFGLSTSAWVSKTRFHIHIIRIRMDHTWKLSTPPPPQRPDGCPSATCLPHASASTRHRCTTTHISRDSQIIRPTRPVKLKMLSRYCFNLQNISIIRS
jgi:hypothetical protein